MDRNDLPATKGHGRTSNAYDWVKAASEQRAYTVWFQPDDILRKAKYGNGKVIARDHEEEGMNRQSTEDI